MRSTFGARVFLDLDIRHEPEGRRFVARIDGMESVLVYAPIGGGAVDFISTYVPPPARGRDVGEALVLEALEWARAEGLTVIPSCWFVGTVVRRHPPYAPLLG